MKFEVNEKVFAFTMLLYGQQLFLQMFNKDLKEVDEFKHIKPIIKRLHQGLSEENRIKGYEKALRYKGWERPILKDFDDIWYIMYIISNYRVEWIDIKPDETRKEIEVMKYALINVAKKAYKHYSEYRSRHV
jgi:hypothetical protein|tara:strand:+ start:2236 stop:2631 length:396 start_codon:yes stop_codon:yes gene_type:complete